MSSTCRGRISRLWKAKGFTVQHRQRDLIVDIAVELICSFSVDRSQPLVLPQRRIFIFQFEAIFWLGVVYLELKDKDSALRQHERLAAIDTERADKLYGYINNQI